MFAAIGCGGLIGLCCLSSGAGYLIKQSSYESGGVDHATRFLGYLQGHDTTAAFAATQYLGGIDGLYSQTTFEQCIGATVLGDVTSYECDDASGSFVSDEGVDVECTVTSAAHGQSEVTIHVNSPDDTPYLGFIWFPPSAWMGDAWHGDSCATWSGREYFREPPEGRVRP